MPRLLGSANPNWKGGLLSKTCQVCRKGFQVKPGRPDAICCSLACFNELQRREPRNTGPRIARVVVSCRGCGKPLERIPSRATKQTCCSPRCRSVATLRKRNTYSSARRGRRADLGNQFFRSAWEANYARYLNWRQARQEISGWTYEPETFWFEKIRRGVRSYTPDFRVVGPDGAVRFVELKGWMDPKSITRIKRLRKYYPEIVLQVVDSKAYRFLEKQIGAVIPGWEFSR